MYCNKALQISTPIIAFIILASSITLITPAMASSKGGGSVAQEKVNSGSSSLDKEINKFYSCISRTHQDPPTIEKVDSCYYQGVGGSGIGNAGSSDNNGLTGSGDISGPSSASSGHNHKHHTSAGSSDLEGSGTGMHHSKGEIAK
jgi:hypothetical protein